jgi:hypothetical protein
MIFINHSPPYLCFVPFYFVFFFKHKTASFCDCGTGKISNRRFSKIVGSPVLTGFVGFDRFNDIGGPGFRPDR